jgi:hypothetical protein
VVEQMVPEANQKATHLTASMVDVAMLAEMMAETTTMIAKA